MIETDLTEVLPIIQTVQSTSSGTGMSYYTSAMKCARRARLDKEHADTKRKFQDNVRLDIGTLAHGLLAYYYERQKRDAVIQLDDVNLKFETAEATRIFDAYSLHFPPSELGTVIGVEMQFPRNQLELEIMQRTVGLSTEDKPFTMRLDLVIEVTEGDIKRLETTRPMLILPGPGIYIVDHKTQSQRGTDDHIKYRYLPQFIAYQMCWNALHPWRQCRGMIANVMVRHKEMTFERSFYSILCPSPTAIDEAAIRRFTPLAHRQSLTDEPNLASCFDFGPCPHLTAGICDRT